MKDSRSLHFLKNFPAWIVLFALLLIVLGLYVWTADQFFQRVLDTVLGALLGLLTGRWLPQTTVSADTISTEVNLDNDTENKTGDEN